MKFNNHRVDFDSRFFLGNSEGDNLTAFDDFQFSEDDDDIKASKDLEFFIRKPFCGCGKCSM